MSKFTDLGSELPWLSAGHRERVGSRPYGLGGLDPLCPRIRESRSTCAGKAFARLFRSCGNVFTCWRVTVRRRTLQPCLRRHRSAQDHLWRAVANVVALGKMLALALARTR